MDQPDAKHPDYVEMAPVWQACRDAIKGQRAIRERGAEYLPPLDGQTARSKEYKAYLKRASYYPATGRTVTGMLGLVFRKAPTFVPPKAMEPWTSDITMTGKSLNSFARVVMDNVLQTGRHGILVDYPQAPEAAPGSQITKAEAERAGVRPYLTGYTAECILHWERKRINNREVLFRVMLEEVDPLKTDQTQIRELTIASGEYQQIIWRKDAKGWTAEAPIVPKKAGQALTEIPFFFVGTSEGNGDIDDPPIEGLADVNISHFRNSADLENGAHLSGLPTPYIVGALGAVDETGNKVEIHLGGSTALLLPENAEPGFMQCGAEGFATIEKLMDRKEGQMAMLGARLIAPEKREAETAETTSIKKGGESSILAVIAASVSSSITKALLFAAAWAGITEAFTFELNRDYLVVEMAPAMLAELMKSWQAGLLSHETVFTILAGGELLPPGLTFKDEQERLASQGPPPGSEPDDDDQ